MIGNAVPVNLAFEIAVSIKNVLSQTINELEMTDNANNTDAVVQLSMF